MTAAVLLLIFLPLLLYSRHALMYHFANQIVLGFSLGYFIASSIALLMKSEFIVKAFES